MSHTPTAGALAGRQAEIFPNFLSAASVGPYTFLSFGGSRDQPAWVDGRPGHHMQLYRKVSPQMTLDDLKSSVNARALSGRGRRSRWLAAPATGLLLTSLLVGLVPGGADAATTGKLSVSPSGASVILARARPNSKTVVNIKVPVSLPFYGAVQLRSATSAIGYRAKVAIAAGGAVTVSISRVSGGSETRLGSPQSTGLTVKRGKTIRLQGAVAGANPVRVFVRAWAKGKSAPRWQLAVRDYDSRRITASGRTRLWGSAPAVARIAFSRASTAAISVRAAKSYKAKTRVSIPASAASSPTPPPAQPPTPPPATTPAAAGKPSAASTGVKAGSTLTRHDGDITITQDGTVLSNLDIHGFVTVRARNVTISNSIVRGGKSKGHATGLITNYGFTGLQISDVRIVPEFPSVYFDGIKGSEFTARRVHISGGVDSVKIHGNNVTIEQSLLENTDSYASDPQQSGGPTHNDNVQILNGANLRLTGNTIRGARNFAILGAASKGNTNLVLSGNWLDGGHCTVKLQVLNGYSETATVTGNKFGPHRKMSTCAFTSYPTVSLMHSSNTFELTGKAVNPLVTVS